MSGVTDKGFHFFALHSGHLKFLGLEFRLQCNLGILAVRLLYGVLAVGLNVCLALVGKGATCLMAPGAFLCGVAFVAFVALDGRILEDHMLQPWN